MAAWPTGGPGRTFQKRPAPRACVALLSRFHSLLGNQLVTIFVVFSLIDTGNLDICRNTPWAELSNDRGDNPSHRRGEDNDHNQGGCLRNQLGYAAAVEQAASSFLR